MEVGVYLLSDLTEHIELLVSHLQILLHVGFALLFVGVDDVEDLVALVQLVVRDDQAVLGSALVDEN